MKFSTIKEMDTKLKEITDKSLLEEDITVMSQGVEIFLQYIGEGSNTDGKAISYMGTTTADNMRVKFTETPTGIEVYEVKVVRQ